jgi:WD40 repeat protein
LLLRAAAHRDEPHMPPADNNVGAKPLNAQQLGLLERWIDEGAGGTAESASTAQVAWSPLPATFQPILDVALTPDGRYAACNRANRLLIRDLRGGSLTQELIDPALDDMASPAAHRDLIRSLAFSPDGTLLASGGYRTVKLWRRSELGERKRFQTAANPRVVAISGDGELLAVAEDGNAVQLWNLETGKEQRRIENLAAPVTAISLSEDGAKLCIACDKNVFVVHTSDGSSVASWQAPAQVTAIALLSDDRVLTGTTEGKIQRWGAAASGDDAKPEQEWQAHSRSIVSLAAVSNERLFSAGEDGTACLWNAASGEQIAKYAHDSTIRDAAISPTGDVVASAGSDYARLYAGSDGRRIADLKGDAASLQHAEALRNRLELTRNIASYRKRDFEKAEQRAKRREDDLKKTRDNVKKAEEDREKQIKAAEKPRMELAEAEAEAASAKEAYDGAKAAVEELVKQAEASPGDESIQKQLDEARQAQSDAEKANQAASRKLNEVMQRTRSAIQTADKAIETLDTVTSQQQREEQLEQLAKAEVDAIRGEFEKTDQQAKSLETESKSAAQASESRPAMTTVSISADGRFAAIGGEGGRVQLYDAASGSLLEAIAGHDQQIIEVAFLPSGELLAVDASGLVTIHAVAPKWTLAGTIGSFDDPTQLADRVLALAFSPDGQFLATGGGLPARCGEVKLWRVADGSLVRSIENPHADTVQCLAFLPNGKQFASGSADQTIKLFDAADGAVVRTLEGHTGHVLDLAAGGDGSFLASASADRSVKLWETATGEQLETYTGNAYRIGPFRGAITSVAFVGDTEQIVCAAGDGLARLLRTGSDRDIRVYAAPGGFLQAAAVTRDGSVVVAGDQQGVLHTWNGYTGRDLRSFAP